MSDSGARTALSTDVDDDSSAVLLVSGGDEIMLIDNYDEEDADGPEQRPKKRGRKTADVWELFTEASQPHKAKSNMCKHCKTLINYHKKIEWVKGKKTALQWWQTDGSEWPDLKKIAIMLFSMATSSAASERNFSPMGFIHSKLRNSLAPTIVEEKLVFIKTNLPAAFYDYPVPDGPEYDSSTDEEAA
ncbi:unnamed protein product [Lampetra planeri]